MSEELRRVVADAVADPNAAEQAANRMQLSLVSAEYKIKELVKEHLGTLARRRASTVRVDHYGVVEAANWQKEVQHFVDKVVLPVLSDAEVAAVHGEGLNSVFQRLIETPVAAHQDALKGTRSDIEGLSPFEFEQWCADELEAYGWSATLTKGGGDQGADVVAELDQVRVVVQCKLYSGTVGNKAVQEAFAAQQFYGASHAAVVTNAPFTRSARELAGNTNVLLLHHTELKDMWRRLQDL